MRVPILVLILFLPPAPLAGASSPAQEPPRATPQAPLPLKKAARLAAVVRTWHEAGLFDGSVLVAHEDGTWRGAAGLAVRGWDVPNGPDTRFPIASLTKMFTAVLVLRAVEQGEIELDASVATYLPWYPADPGERISVRDLLAHTSGLPEIPTSAYLRDLDASEDVRWLVETHATGEPTFEPGTDFLYTNTDYHVLGAILEAVHGRPFEQLLREQVLDPLGMQDTAIARREAVIPRLAQDYVPADGTWQRAPPYRWQNWHAAGGLYSTLEDLHRWNRALFEHELLAPETWETMLTPRTDVGSSGNYVALGVWVYPRQLPGSDLRPTLVERRGAIGGYASLNVLVKDEPTWIVILANSYNEQIHQLPWGASMPLDLLLVLHDLAPQGPP